MGIIITNTVFSFYFNTRADHLLVTVVTDLSASDLWLPQCAEHHVCVLYLLSVGPLALQPA